MGGEPHPMTHGSHYLGKLYNDLIANSPQTISIDIPSDMGKGRIAQTQIKHGIIFSDWQMCYQSDMNVQGTVSKDYMQIIFCLNDAISWGIMDEKRSIMGSPFQDEPAAEGIYRNTKVATELYDGQYQRRTVGSSHQTDGNRISGENSERKHESGK